MMAFFYSAYSVILPIFVRKVFGKTNFVANIGFLWLSYPVGSVLITVLVKALFATIHFSGFSVSIAFCHMISFYAAYSMKKAHKNYLLKQVENRADCEESAQEGDRNRSESILEPSFEESTSDFYIEEQNRRYNVLKTILSL